MAYYCTIDDVKLTLGATRDIDPWSDVFTGSDVRLTDEQVQEFIKRAHSEIQSELRKYYVLPLAPDEETEALLNRKCAILTCLYIYQAMYGSMTMPQRYTEWKEEYKNFIESLKSTTLSGQTRLTNSVSHADKPTYKEINAPEVVRRRGIPGIDEVIEPKVFGNDADGGWNNL
jgi:phage gp36-like protein